jgi:ribose transport system permease protein
MLSKNAQSPFFTSVVIASRYIPVWVANAVLIIVILFIAPSTLSRTSFSAVLPLTSFLAMATLGQMLVIMTGGIDLSVPGVMTLAAMITVGVGSRSDDRLILAIVTALAMGGAVGLANGFFIGVFKLNALIVTLAVGQVVRGIGIEYAAGVANEASVPANFSSWSTSQALGISWIFWVGIGVTVALALLLRYTAAGRRFQSVGANPMAAWIAGIHVNVYIVFAYAVAGMLYALAGVLLAGFIRSPTLSLGTPYLLSPIAAVVIGGASLTGGLASVPSTWAAAFFLTLLNQTLRVLGLSTALQFVAFGLAIVGGMVISGDRIVDVVEGLLQGKARFARMNLNQDEASDFAALDPFGKDADIGESMSNLHEKEPDD